MKRLSRRALAATATLALAASAASTAAAKPAPDIPPPAPTPTINMSKVLLAAQIDPARPDTAITPGSKASVIRVERLLRRRGLLARNLVDGHFGSSTKAAFAAWQRSLGFTGLAANGLPGITSLTAARRHALRRPRQGEHRPAGPAARRLGGQPPHEPDEDGVGEAPRELQVDRHAGLLQRRRRRPVGRDARRRRRDGPRRHRRVRHAPQRGARAAQRRLRGLVPPQDRGPVGRAHPRHRGQRHGPRGGRRRPGQRLLPRPRRPRRPTGPTTARRSRRSPGSSTSAPTRRLSRSRPRSGARSWAPSSRRG